MLPVWLPLQSVHTNGVMTESKPAAKRNQKAGKKPGGRSGKEASKKSHNSRGKSVLFYRTLSFIFRDLTYFFTTFQTSVWVRLCSVRDTRVPAADVTSVHDVWYVETSSRVDKSQPEKEQHKLTHAAYSFHTSSFSLLDPGFRWKDVMKSLVSNSYRNAIKLRSLTKNN